jgi:hypothetical protein
VGFFGNTIEPFRGQARFECSVAAQQRSISIITGFRTMSGLKSAAFASVLVLMGGSAAWAQTSSSNPEPQPNAAPSAQSASGQFSSGANISADTQQKIRQSLEQSGFKDIRVVPETFVVRARAPDGSRIVMLLSPDQLTEVVTPNANQGMANQGMANQGMQGNSSQPFAGQSGYQTGTNNGLNTQQQAQQELSRYGYTSLQDVAPMRGWVADATKNGEHVRVMLSDNGLVATFPGR